VRHVGGVTGSSVDWQPLPVKPRSCLTPPGSKVIASSDTAVVSQDQDLNGASQVWLGCLRADGRQRVLAAPPPGILSAVPSEAAVAGNYAALVFISGCNRYYESNWSATVKLVDLRTGAQVPNRGGESAAGPTYTPENASTCESSMDQLVLSSDAVSAVHITLKGQDVNGNSCTCTAEQIEANDSTGVHTLDSITEPDGSPTALTNLTLTGDTLTWQHNGSPRSARLQP
jgi:hypothetical protein